jgi:hypothetical protein
MTRIGELGKTLAATSNRRADIILQISKVICSCSLFHFNYFKFISSFALRLDAEVKVKLSPWPWGHIRMFSEKWKYHIRIKE